MTQVATIPAYLLANEHLLHWLLEQPLTADFVQSERDYLHEFVYVDFHARNCNYPDHVFLHRWDNFCSRYVKQHREGKTEPDLALDSSGRCSLVLACMECLRDEYIEFSHGENHIRLELFSWWQNMLARMSSLPVQSYAAWRTAQTRKSFRESDDLLLYPYDEGVEKYIADTGLNDSHIHVNLMAGAEVCWLQSLRFAEKEWKERCKAYVSRPKVRELYREVHMELNPDKMLSHAKIAKRLRYLLQCYADDKCLLPPNTQAGEHGETYSLYDFLVSVKNLSPLQLCEHSEWGRQWENTDEGAPRLGQGRMFFQAPDVRGERDMLRKVMEKLALKANPLVDRVLHLYILLLNEYCMFCVQQDNMKGFRQFDKYSQLPGAFKGSAAYYVHIFLNMHGSGYNSVTLYAELRIAPSISKFRTSERLRMVLNGYLNYLLLVQAADNDCRDGLFTKNAACPHECRHMDELLEELDACVASISKQRRVVLPAITIHLIKREISSPEDRGYRELREDCRKQLKDLGELFIAYPRLRAWVRGIDAAADEMDTPPDVFASAFRQARDGLGIKHVTYHAGEDFAHLISGIRSIYEATVMLEYRRGDRIGHATAVGVDPALWVRSMPPNVSPTRGEWLLDMVFVWTLLHEEENMHDLTRKLDYDIRAQACVIFETPNLAPFFIRRVFALRHLDVDKFLSVYDACEAAAEQYIASRSLQPKDSIQDTATVVRLSVSSILSRNTYRYSTDVELRRVVDAFSSESPEVIALLVNWYRNDKTYKRSRQRIEVAADYLSVEDLVKLQQMVMDDLRHKGVILESLPTSNLRISQYQRMGEHHSLRWLGAHRIEGDSPPPFVLGSDDPGIFATDIKGEFYHLFAELCKKQYNSQEALSYLARLNQNGRSYAFRSLLRSGPSEEQGIAAPLSSYLQ